jgi:hypothetical protein
MAKKKRRFFKMKKKEKKQPHYPLRKGDANPNAEESKMSPEELRKCQEDPYYLYKNYLRPKGHKLMTREEFSKAVEDFTKHRDEVMPKEEQEKLRDLKMKKDMEARGVKDTEFDGFFNALSKHQAEIAEKFKQKDEDGNIIPIDVDKIHEEPSEEE